MRGLLLTGPSEDIENPSEEHLRRLIFESDEMFWNAGCGEMAIQLLKPAQSEDESTRDDPMLLLFFEASAGFFFQFQPVRGDVLVPYDGTSCDDLVSHYVGGEPFWVPRACYVSREMAWHIVRNYAEHREPSPLVTWVPFEHLRYVVPGYGE